MSKYPEYIHIISGWYTYPSKKNDGVSNSWDDEIPN